MINIIKKDIISAELYSALILSQHLKFEFDNISYKVPELSIMICINNNKDISSSEVAQKIGCTKSFISQVVKRLENEEYLYRKQLSNKKRFYGLYLTAKGKKVVEEWKKIVSEQNENILNTILKSCSEDEFEIFLKVGKITGQAMQKIMENYL